jgi:hypothetical protein
MNAYIAIFHRSEKYTDYHGHESFRKHLPLEPTSSHHYQSPNHRIEIYSYTVGQPWGYAPLIQNRDLGCVIDGILLPKDESQDQLDIETLIRQQHPREFQDVMGEFSLVCSDGQELFTTSDIGGSHSLYFAETDDLVAISNRSICLLGIASLSHALNESGVAWKAYQGFISEENTAFKAIRKIRNGSRVKVLPNGDLKETRAGYSMFVNTEPVVKMSENPMETFSGIVEYLAKYLHRTDKMVGASGIDFPLSGGKDSRALFSLTLGAGLKDRIDHIWTRGTPYSPEVLAAQDLCHSTGLSNLHQLRKPPYIAKANINPGMVIRTINNNEGLTSLYDFAGIDRREFFRIQGHQSAYRRGRFSNCRIDSFENFLTDIQKTYPNPLNSVLDKSALEKEVEHLFNKFLNEGAPLESMGDLSRIFDRIHSWTAVLSNTDYCSGPVSNPIIMGEFARFSFRIPHQHRRNEIFHFLCIYLFNPELLQIPFAEQTWPPTIRESMKALGIEYKYPFPKPYRTHQSFPNLQSPWIPNVKLEYYKALRPFVLEVLSRPSSVFKDLLDVPGILRFLKETDSPNFLELYTIMGIYSSAIMEEYGSNLFDRTQHTEIQKDLTARMDIPESSTAADPNSPEAEVWKDMISKHEDSIAALVREVQS